AGYRHAVSRAARAAAQGRSMNAVTQTTRVAEAGPGDGKLVMALPKGRILKEVMPLLLAAGIEPEPEFADENSRKLRFATSQPDIELIRVRSFDVATFVAFGAAQLGVAGNDVLRSEEHTSELQSREKLVCRLLLEKK